MSPSAFAVIIVIRATDKGEASVKQATINPMRFVLVKGTAKNEEFLAMYAF